MTSANASTLLCLLADSAEVQKLHRAAKKAQAMTGVNELVTLASQLVGSKNLKSRLIRPYIKLEHPASALHRGLPIPLWLFFFFLKKKHYIFSHPSFGDLLWFLKGFGKTCRDRSLREEKHKSWILHSSELFFWGHFIFQIMMQRNNTQVVLWGWRDGGWSLGQVKWLQFEGKKIIKRGEPWRSPKTCNQIFKLLANS